MTMMRYRCKEKKHLFNSYDANLLKQLTLCVQSEFPAILTHHFGVPSDIVKVMRPMFQYGNGPRRLSKLLRILHKKKYDDLQLQYYNSVQESFDNRKHEIQRFFGAPEQQFEPFSSFVDRSKYIRFRNLRNLFELRVHFRCRTIYLLDRRWINMPQCYTD